MVEHQFEARFEALPEGLAELAGGPALATALSALDPARTQAEDLPVLLAAIRRQLSADEARFARCAHELASVDVSEPGVRGEVLGEFSADEVRAVLSVSRTAAWRLIGRAEDVTVRLPQLGAAWDHGEIDADRVRVFCTWTDALSGDHARRVVAEVLPEAPRMTQSALIARIREVAIALDPEWARRLYENSVRQRRVRARPTAAGTANLSGLDLPLDAAARSVAHITAMASKAKAAGHPAGIDTVRADVFLALLDPDLAGADDRTLIAAVLRRAQQQASDDDPSGLPDPSHAPPEDPRPTDHSDEPGDRVEPEPSRHRRGPRQARPELRVGLATLLGLDRRPARLPGWGVVHADLARQIARDHTDGEWRVAVAGPTGALTAALITRHRPLGYRTTPSDRGAEAGARPVVQLHVDEAFLDRVDPADHPAWARLLIDLRHQLALWRQARRRRRRRRRVRPRATPPGAGPVPRRGAGPMDRDARPAVRVPAVRGVRDGLRPRPHPRVRRGARPHRGRQPGTGLPSRAPDEARDRVAPRAARTRSLRLDEPDGPPLHEPRERCAGRPPRAPATDADHGPVWDAEPYPTAVVTGGPRPPPIPSIPATQHPADDPPPF